VFLIRALPIDISYFSPKETLSPFVVMLVSKPFELKLALLDNPSFEIISYKLVSDDKPNGSRFSFRLPSNIKGSWGTIEKLLLKLLRLILLLFYPFINIFPSDRSINLVRPRVKDVFPEPVLPNTPIFWFRLIIKLIPWRLSGILSRYLKQELSNLIISSSFLLIST